MSSFTLHLKNNNDTTILPLIQKESEEPIKDYFDKGNGEYIYNDYYYSLQVIDELGNSAPVDKLFVNNEIIEDVAFLSGHRASCIFLECFGVVKIEVIINGESYITHNTRIVMKENAISTNIVNMIDYIYENCDDYLYEEHKHSKTGVGVMPNPNISIDTKLSLLEEIYDVYVKSYHILKHSAQNKLINTNKIGSFNELQSIRQNTINYIVNHPEELQPVNYNSGISVNKQYYEPQKTLVQSVAYSCDIYENQVLVGFLKTIVQELEEIKLSVELHKNQNTSPYRQNGYVDSAYYIYTKNIKMLNSYIEVLCDWMAKFKKLYLEYKRILNISELNVISVPRYTNIFRRIMPYNIVFEKILRWFNCGNYDLSKSDLLLSFVSISKIYEYFCLIKINRTLEKCGYSLISGFPFKYAENRYYRNTVYNNTFEFSKDAINITVYYQPIIYDKTNNRERPNGIGLFRNTSISITDPTALAILDERKAKQGSYYNPDYLIKISSNNNASYHILDAKHSSPNNIKRYQLPFLAFKYLFSISTLQNGKSVDSMCIICGKTTHNSSENIYDIAETMDINIHPMAHICNVTGDDIDNDKDLIEYIGKIEELASRTI